MAGDTNGDAKGVERPADAVAVTDVNASVLAVADGESPGGPDAVVKRTYGGEPAEEINVPEMSYLQLTWIFLRFGCLAFGGPVQQIAMMKEQLVDKEGWCTAKRFQRVFGVFHC